MLTEVRLRLFDTGYCLQFEKMTAKSRPLRLKRYYAMAGLIEHPALGPILFDTGYSTHLLQLCRRLPYAFYRLITPLRHREGCDAADRVARFGYRPEDIKHVVISHFHPDHIGGLKDFKEARFYSSVAAYTQLKKLSYTRALKELFFAELLPHDFEERLVDIGANPVTLPFQPFAAGFDLFGDQSVVAVALPGHAAGHYGVFLKDGDKTILLAADACWQSDNYLDGDLPHYLARAALNDYPAFCTTLGQLSALKANSPDIEIIPSHCLTMWQRYVMEASAC